MPISLPPDCHTAIERAARPLDPQRRDAFVAAVLDALATVPELGEGAAFRTIRALQREFWDPPITSEGHARHSTRSKLRLGPAVS
jgi:hypothetical protein